MQILRVYLKFNGCFVDVPANPPESNIDINGVMTTWKMDGYLVKASGTGAPFAIPWDGWAFCAILSFGDDTTMKGATFDFTATRKPN